ncbi:MAG: hypothetical protein J6T72_03300 [Alphaproteobacteria bacterium]|nr:hypothetical protein [Alphaproteobacteria bacterium]
MNLTKEEQKNLHIAIRQFLYFLTTFAFVGIIYLLTKNFNNQTFNENGVVENIQLMFLLSSVVTFLYCALTEEKWRELSFLLASVSLLASCRELDKVFDQILPILSWKFAYLFVITATIYAWKHYKKTLKTILHFFGMPSFYIMCIAVVMILPVAQCIGHRPVISAVLGPRFTRYDIAVIKELFEEALEVVGYLLILLSAVEYKINIKEHK